MRISCKVAAYCPSADLNKCRTRRWSRLVGSCAGFLLAATLSSTYAAEEGACFSSNESAKYSDAFQAGSHNTYANYPASQNYKPVLDKTGVIEFDTHPWNAWRVYHTLPVESLCKENPYQPKRLNQCLTNVRNWHDANPDHPPITIFIEIKSTNGWKVPDFNGILYGKTRNSGDGGRSKNDAVFACEDIFRPGDLAAKQCPKSPGNKCSSLQDAAQQGQWPTMGELKGKVIFVVNGQEPYVEETYLNETEITTECTNNSRAQAAAFVMMQANNEQVILGKSSPLGDKSTDVVFFNNQCKKWTAGMGDLIRKNNYISRGYYCSQDSADLFINKWIGEKRLNFPVYDSITNPYADKSWLGGRGFYFRETDSGNSKEMLPLCPPGHTKITG